jgi:homoserine kinase
MPPTTDTATVRVPGTTANLGSGFDTLGLALTIYNQVTVTRSTRGVRILSPISEEARPGATAMLAEAAQAFFEWSNSVPFGFEISITGDVPLARGLGSSVTARLGCVAALNRLTGDPLSRGDLLNLVTRLEGHPDNAAPAVHGGFTASGLVRGSVRCLRFPVARELKFVTLIPDFEISTPEARRLVPMNFTKRDTVHSLNRTALITSAFASGDYEALRGCFDDCLHQPYREALLPQLSAVLRSGEAAGAIGGWLSGSGSTIMAITLGDVAPVAEAMQRELPGSKVVILTADDSGLKVL